MKFQHHWCWNFILEQFRVVELHPRAKENFFTGEIPERESNCESSGSVSFVDYLLSVPRLDVEFPFLLCDSFDFVTVLPDLLQLREQNPVDPSTTSSV